MTPVTEAVPALKLSARINRIEPSATMAVVAEAEKLRQQGLDVVDFGAGEPHFATPQHIKDAAIAAIQNNFTKYTAVGGTAELRDAIVKRHAADFGSNYRREETMASTGGKHVLFNAIQVLVDHGDEVILPVPYWVSFKDIVRYAGGNCVLLETEEGDGFRVTAEMVERLVTPRTKLIILNSPSNPSGDGRAARHLGDFGRVLCLPELHPGALFDGGAAGISRTHGDCGVVVEDLCHDRMADGLCLVSGSGFECHVEVTEPVDVESDLDCAESCGSGSDRSATVRRRHATGVHQAAGSCGWRAEGDPRRDLHHAPRGVLCLSQPFRILRTE
jgi:hypothetical protein